MESQLSSLDNWISNGNTYINKLSKSCTDSFTLKRPHTIIKMNSNINMDGTIVGSMNAQLTTSMKVRISVSNVTTNSFV